MRDDIVLTSGASLYEVKDDLPTRGFNILMRESITTLGELMALSEGEMLNMRNMNPETALAIQKLRYTLRTRVEILPDFTNPAAVRRWLATTKETP